MTRRIRDIMLSLSEYAVVSENATILEALEVLRDSQQKLLPERQPHRAVLVRDGRGEIVGKVHYFAFLRAMVSDRGAMLERTVMDRAGVGDDLRETSMRILGELTSDFVDFRERASRVRVREVYTAATLNIDENATIADAIGMFIAHHTLSLLVRRGKETVGILRLSDLFDELGRQILGGHAGKEGA